MFCISCRQAVCKQMGSRINYIIKNNETLLIYHNRWGANRLAYTLYLGENSFLTYIRENTPIDHLSDHGWMEGFVIADTAQKILGFWSWELTPDTSVLDYYLSELQKKWPGWQLIYLANYMYDAQPLLGFDYISTQILPAYTIPPAHLMLHDGPDDDYPQVLCVIKQQSSIHVVETMTIQLDHIICYGEASISILQELPSISLPVEGETRPLHHMVIDPNNKQLIVNDSIFGIWEAMAHKWPGYTLKMGCMGYRAMLEAAGIPTAGLQMQEKKIIAAFSQMITLENS